MPRILGPGGGAGDAAPQIPRAPQAGVVGHSEALVFLYGKVE